MPALEVVSSNPICSQCGMAYSRRKGFFPTSYAAPHKGIGYIHICKKCIDDMYNGYLNQGHSPAESVRQLCRKLDLYFNEDVFNSVYTKSSNRSIMTRYITRINSAPYTGRCYDDTLSDEGTLWSFNNNHDEDLNTNSSINDIPQIDTAEDCDQYDDIPEDVIALWGRGLSSDMYRSLEQRRAYWMSRLPSNVEIDIGTEAIIKQICSLELDINRDRAAGKSIDKSVNALNTLLGSASLKPNQKKSDEIDSAIENTPFGVWIKRWEDQRPIPEPDPELNDSDGLIRYISIWFLGHLCKMLGIKNTYCKLYEDEISKLRVEHPEYDDEDDETMFNDIFESTDEYESDSFG